MASAFDKYLKKLGIGKKGKYQQERDASPVLSAINQRRQPTYEEIKEQERLNLEAGVTLPRYQGSLKQGERLKNIGGLTYVESDNQDNQVLEEALTFESAPQGGMGGYSQGGQIRQPIPEAPQGGMGGYSQGGLFSPPDTSNILEEDPNMVSGGIVGDVLLPERGEPREKPPLVADQTYNPVEEVFGGIVGNVPVAPTKPEIVQTVKEQAQAIKNYAEQQHQNYIDNMNKRRQERASQMVIDMENQLMEDIMEKEQKRKDSFALIELENQVQSANNQMDRTNLLLRESGLFGQGMGGPSYGNPMQPTMPGQPPLDPGLSISSPYANPEYYQAGVALSNASADPNSPLYDPQYANRPVEYYNLPKFNFVPNPRPSEEEWTVG